MSNSTTGGGGGGSGDVVGPASSTDNAVARFDSTTGKLLQNSVVIVDDVGVTSGITQLDVDNIRIDGNTISSTDTDGNITLTPDGTGVIAGTELTLTTDLAVAHGGTGASTLTGVLTGNGASAVTANAVTQYGVLVGGASNAVSSTAVGSSGQVLTSNGAGMDPTFQAASGGYDVSNFSGGKSYVCEHWLDNFTSGSLGWTISNQNSGTSLLGDIEGHLGTTIARRQTAANAASMYYLGNDFLGEFAFKFGFYLQIPTLPDATDRFDIECGIGSSTTATGSISDGIFFRYVDDENSGNWQIICEKDGTQTNSDSAVAADTNWVYLEIEANSDWSSISFYIDGTETSNSPISTNVPTGSSDKLRFFARIQGTDGTATRDLNLDSFYVLTSP